MIQGSYASFSFDGPVVVIAMLDIGIRYHILGIHSQKVTRACVFKHLYRSWIALVNLLYVVDKSLHLRSVLPAAGEPIGYFVYFFIEECDLFFTKKCFAFAVEYFQIVPVINLSVEIKIDASVLL